MSETPMSAGRELDALVAERVMGAGPARKGFHRPDPLYSTSIAAAWLVVEKLRDGRWYFDLALTSDSTWVVTVGSFPPIEEKAAPLAICLAALAALAPHTEGTAT